jgi:nitrous oxidase accessory protein NosD
LNGIGVEIARSGDNLIAANEFYSNNAGVAIGGGRNIIRNNNFTSITRDLMLTEEAPLHHHNKIYHNNFLSSKPYYVTKDLNDFWDNGYESGGNYWSDYTSPDSDGDGIVDSPKFVFEDNYDHFPVTEPDGWLNIAPSKSVHNIDTNKDYSSIQAAVDDAGTGDTIKVDGGTITGTGYYYENVQVDKTINIIGEDRLTTTVISRDSDGNGFTLKSDNIQISNFTIRSGTRGVRIEHSRYCEISNNNLTVNFYGVEINGGSLYNLITANEFYSNEDGMVIGGARNTIRNNDFMSNTKGIRIVGVGTHNSYNKIYHNNFFNSKTYHAADFHINIWDNGYPDGGNYWDDYTGIDADGDGIGDTPYVIDLDSQDNYPLMNPFSQDPVILIENIIDQIESLGLPDGIQSSLITKLDNAVKSIANDRPSVFGQLGAFINEVNAQRGVSLTNAEADSLIAAAQTVIDKLNSS